MNADEQVAMLFRFALTIGPIAVYFLALGLLNAQSRPQLLGGRADFVLLAVVFFPLLMCVMVMLADLPWAAIAAAAFLAGLGFYWLMPRRHSRWVIYNVTPGRFERALARALARSGYGVRPDPRPAAQDESVWVIPELGLRIRLSPFSLLRNVTCLLERLDGGPINPRQLNGLRQALQSELETIAALPSVSAACFILIGTVMLTAPLLLMAQHMDSIVKVVRSLFV